MEIMKLQQILFLMILFIQNSICNQYLGCYQDDQNRDLSYYAGNNYTIPICIQECTQLGYKYSGLQNYGQCYCGNQYGIYGQLQENLCNTECTLNTDQICGGVQINSIFNNEIDEQDQICYDHLGTLLTDSIKNDCEAELLNEGIYHYNFQIEYLQPYVFDSNCLQQTITFQGIQLELGNDLWQWQFDGTFITFTIPHSDLENANCTKGYSVSEYTWQCEMDLHIWFKNVEQFQYSFYMTSTLSRTVQDSIEVTIDKNNVIGDCCENVLDVLSELNFCEDFSCNNYLPSPITVERLQNIYVEHRITTIEFQHYYLNKIQLKLGSFIPKIDEYNNNIPGKIIYQFKSSIALENMKITAISLLSDIPSRRFLAEKGDIGEENNYKLKAEKEFTVVENLEEFMQRYKQYNQQQIEQEVPQIEKSDSTLQIGIIVGVGCLVIIGLLISIFYIKKKLYQKNIQEHSSVYSSNYDGEKLSDSRMSNMSEYPGQSNNSNNKQQQTQNKNQNIKQKSDKNKRRFSYQNNNNLNINKQNNNFNTQRIIKEESLPQLKNNPSTFNLNNNNNYSLNTKQYNQLTREELKINKNKRNSDEIKQQQESQKNSNSSNNLNYNYISNDNNSSSRRSSTQTYMMDNIINNNISKQQQQLQQNRTQKVPAIFQTQRNKPENLQILHKELKSTRRNSELSLSKSNEEEKGSNTDLQYKNIDLEIGGDIRDVENEIKIGKTQDFNIKQADLKNKI